MEPGLDLNPIEELTPGLKEVTEDWPERGLSSLASDGVYSGVYPTLVAPNNTQNYHTIVFLQVTQNFKVSTKS